MRARYILLLAIALFGLTALAGGALGTPAAVERTYQNYGQSQGKNFGNYQNTNNDNGIVSSQKCGTEVCGTNFNAQQCSQYGCCWDGYTCLLPTPAPSCDVSLQNRTACGWPGITPQECEAYDCCWLPPPAGQVGSFCFYKPGDTPTYTPVYPEANCNISNRVSCAAIGNKQFVTESECVSKGCCYDANYMYTGSNQNQQSGFCYEPLGTCFVDANERQNCGYPGINANQCYQKGCCYEPVYPYPGSNAQQLSQVPWCYYKQPLLQCSTPDSTVCGQECCDATQTCVLQERDEIQQEQDAKQQNQYSSASATSLPTNTNCACKSGYTNCGKISTPLWYGFDRLLCCPSGSTCGTSTCICPAGQTFVGGVCA